jgi:flagellar protein FlbT
MALKVELKPGERIIVGDCVITNDNQRTRLFIEGDTPILREKDVLTARNADTAAKRIYLAVQLMYLSRDRAAIESEYRELRDDFLAAAPSSQDLVAAIDKEILTGAYYKAMRAARQLVAFEEDLLRNVQRSVGVFADPKADSQSS